MATQKFVTLESGRDKLKAATVISAGAGNAGEITALDSAGKLDVSVMPVGIAPDVKVLATSENLAAGDYVNIYNVTGTPTARLADQSNDRPAHGYVKASSTSPANCTVYFEGSNSDNTGLTPGARQYLSTVGGTTEVAAISGLHQFLGIAVSATEINTDIDDEIVIL